MFAALSRQPFAHARKWVGLSAAGAAYFSLKPRPAPLCEEDRPPAYEESAYDPVRPSQVAILRKVRSTTDIISTCVVC